MRGFTPSPPPPSRRGRAAPDGRAAALVLAFTLLTCAHDARAAQNGGPVAGRVTDPAGSVVVGATLILKDAAGAERRAASDAEGRYAFGGLAPGAYTLRVEARGFQNFEAAGVRVVAGRRGELDVRLAVALERQLGEGHSLGLRYNYYRHRAENASVGGVVPERGFAFTLPVRTRAAAAVRRVRAARGASA